MIETQKIFKNGIDKYVKECYYQVASGLNSISACVIFKIFARFLQDKKRKRFNFALCSRKSVAGKKNEKYGRNVTIRCGGDETSQKEESEKSNVRYADSSRFDYHLVAFRFPIDLDGFGIVAIGRRNAPCQRILGYARAERLALGQLRRSISCDSVYAVFQKQRDRYVAYGRRHGAGVVFGFVCVFEAALARAEFRVYVDACHDDTSELYPDDSYF